MRPYQSSLVCNVAESELLVLSRTEFYRTFKHSTDSWRNAVKVAKAKELEYIKRCQNYLTRSNELITQSKTAVKRTLFNANTNSKNKVDVKKIKQERSDRRVMALKERENKKLYI